MMFTTMEKLTEERKKIEKEVRARTTGYIVAAFGFVAGLAWNDAIRSLIESIFPLAQNTLLAKFIYAILITLVLVVATIYINRIMTEEIPKE